MKSIRGGTGLGDALYVQAVARHIIRTRDERLRVCTDWPDVFKPLGDKVSIAPFTRNGITYLAHYSQRKPLAHTDQFEDCCQAAGITEPVDFRLDWVLEDHALVERVHAHGKPVVLVQLPRAPMGRTDGFGAELLPDCRRIQSAIDMIGDRATKVLIGHGKALFTFSGIDIDLSGKTSVSQVLDLASVASGFLGYVSFFVPLAESFNKHGLFVWSRRGLKSGHPYVQNITPAKILHRPSSRAVIDDCLNDELASAVETFLNLEPVDAIC